jgi:hypothetical protein
MGDLLGPRHPEPQRIHVILNGSQELAARARPGGG